MSGLLYEEKIADYAEGKPIFSLYREFIIDSFESSVIDKIFDSESFARRFFLAVRKYLFNFKGIFAIVGISVASLWGLDTAIKSTAQGVFEEQIKAEYPQLVKRLEQDRETLMLLVLDLNLQKNSNVEILRSNDLGLNHFRKTYLKNPNYEDVLAGFLRGERELDFFSPLFKREEDEYELTQKIFTLKYIVEISSIAGIEDELIDILKEDFRSTNNLLSQRHTYIQILAVQALRKYENQLDNLIRDVLLKEKYKVQFSENFWRGFLNNLILDEISDKKDISLVRSLLANFKSLDSYENLANTVLMVYMTYPELCQRGDDYQCPDLESWLKSSKDFYREKNNKRKTDNEKSRDNPESEQEIDNKNGNSLLNSPDTFPSKC